MDNNVNANKNYKDSLFKFLFEKDKKNALDLYNAMNGTKYKNVDELEFVSLENAFFIKMRNDVAFVFNSTLNLYEHQSTYNPNMPLRGLFYFADLYRTLIDTNKLYGSKLIKIPTPQFIVFYNGIDKKTEDTEILKLSDAFELESTGGFEWTATMININKGHSNKYLDNCKVLADYSEFVSRIRQKTCVMTLESAIIETIKECIEEGILEEFLQKYHEEVSMMVWPEFDEELYRKIQREEDREELREELIIEVRKEVREEFKEEVREEVKEEVKEEVREEVKEEVKEEVREEVKEEVKEEVREEVKEEVKEEVREKVKEEVKEEIREEVQKEEIKRVMQYGKMSFEEACKLLGIEDINKYRGKDVDRLLKLDPKNTELLAQKSRL